MEDGVASAVWGFLGALVGGGVSVLTTWINNAHGSQLEIQRSRELRVEAARQFQRTTILSIQDELFNTTKAISDLGAYVKLKEELGESLQIENTAALQALNNLAAKLGTLNERVADNSLRMKILEFLVHFGKWGAAKTSEEVDQLLEGYPERLADVHDSLGVVLRSHFEPIHSPEAKPARWRRLVVACAFAVLTLIAYITTR